MRLRIAEFFPPNLKGGGGGEGIETFAWKFFFNMNTRMNEVGRNGC